MAHGTEQHAHARALTPVFTRYATLLQATKDRGFQKPNAALCITPIVRDSTNYKSVPYKDNLLFLQHSPRYLCYDGVVQQPPQSTRRNALPVKLIDGSLLMGHEYLACALV